MILYPTYRNLDQTYLKIVIKWLMDCIKNDSVFQISIPIILPQFYCKIFFSFLAVNRKNLFWRFQEILFEKTVTDTEKGACLRLVQASLTFSSQSIHKSSSVPFATKIWFARKWTSIENKISSRSSAGPPSRAPYPYRKNKGNPPIDFLLVAMASGFARVRAHARTTTTTTATESRKMAAILQLIG